MRRHLINLDKSPRTSIVAAALIIVSTGAANLAGCHSAFVETTLTNRTDRALHLVEVDYPSASFGTQNLQPGASFYYKFKVIGEGPMKLTWIDDGQKEHNAEGPQLREGQQGTLTITVIPGQTAWQTTFR